MRTALTWPFALLICLTALLHSAAFAEPAPRLDGFLSDPIWATQARTWTLADPTHPGTLTRCYLAYDDQYLYFAADVFDPNVIGVNRTPKSRAWEDDSVRLLVHLGDPAATRWTADTFSYTFSALGGATWTRGPLPDVPDKKTEPGWPPTWNSAMVWAVGLKPGTTPNVTGNRDGGYVVEARIPWNELGVKPPFRPGSTIGACILNICRPELSMPGGKTLSTVAAVREITPTNPSLWQRVRMDWQGPLSARGLVEPLPLWLGSPDPEFAAFQSAETDSRGPWLDRAQWTARLETMRSQNLNTLVLRHTNPLMALLAGAKAGQLPDTRPVDLLRDAFARSGWFDAAGFTRHRDQLRWVLATAKANGIRVYLLLEDTGVSAQRPPCSQPATQASAAPSTAPADPPTVSRAVGRLFEIYPDLAGVAVGAGLNSAENLNAIAAELASRHPAPPHPATTSAPPAVSTRASATSPAGVGVPKPLPMIGPAPTGPELLVWTTAIQPAVARDVIDRYPNTRLLHSLQGGQWFRPLADRGIESFNTLTEQLKPGPAHDPVRNLAMGTLRGANSYLFWADPQWMRNLLLDVRNQGIDGFLLDVGPGEHGLAREAMSDYAYNAGQQYSPQRWESRLRVLGVDQYAGQLLEAIQHASAIVPETLLLVHDPSSRFMPQFGLSLAQCLQMPGYSPGMGGTDADIRGLLLAPLGPAWPDPCWSRSVTGLRADSARAAPANAVAPWEIIANIGKHVSACNAILPALRHLPPKNADQARSLGTLLDAIEFNVLEGDYLRFKLQAAMAWEQYKSRRGRGIDVIDPLRRSVEAFRKLAVLGDRSYPQTLSFWESQIVSPPPWSLELIRRSYFPVHGHWADQLRPLERELDLVQEAVSADGTAANLPLWDLLNAAPPEKRQTRVVIDFEKPDPRYQLLAGASLTRDPGQRISGGASLLIDTRQLPPGRHEAMVTDVGLVPLVSFLHYQVVIAYRVIDPGPAGDPGTMSEPFEIGFHHVTDLSPLGDHRCWTAPKGYMGVRVLQVPPPCESGNLLYIATRAPSAIVIDQIQIAQIAD